MTAQVGLFNFIMDYEWSCDSTAKPLEQLQPPYSFTIRTLVWCGSYCNSEFISGSSLPGFATDLATSEYEYVAQTERVIASDTEMVSIQQWPNLPGVEISKHVNIQTGLAQVVKTFTSKMLSCSSEVTRGQKRLICGHALTPQDTVFILYYNIKYYIILYYIILYYIILYNII